MRGILMIEPLYHQTIAGNKTMTRRSGGLEVVNDTSVQMNGHIRSPDDWADPVFGLTYNTEYPDGFIHMAMFAKKGSLPNSILPNTEVFCKPRYKVGEVLYIKEPIYMLGKRPIKRKNGSFVYKYDSKTSRMLDAIFSHFKDITDLKWSNKMFMPAKAARAFVRITGIKCERLMDISNEDCRAEGIAGVFKYNGIDRPMEIIGWRDYLRKDDTVPAPLSEKDSFISLYKFANKVKEVPNLWVWAYTFEYLPNYKL